MRHRLLLVLVLLCCACRKGHELPSRFNPELMSGRLEIVASQNSVWLSCWILRDSKTGVEYLVVRSGQGVGVTKM